MFESFFGVPQIGAALVPINYRLVAEDFTYILGHSVAKVLLLDPEYAEPIARIRKRLGELEQVVLLRETAPAVAELEAIDIEELLESAADADPPEVAIDERDMCTLNYTSGTTARPKGVMLSHRALVCNALD